MPRNPEPKHRHNYVAKSQKTFEDTKRGGHPYYITYTFLKCEAPGTCNRTNIMNIKRWRSKK